MSPIEDHERGHNCDPILIKKCGDMWTYRWPDTGEEFTLLVVQAFDMPEPRDDVTLTFTVHPGIPLATQMHVLRSLFPSLQSQPAAALMQTLKRDPVMPLGVFTYWEARVLVKQAAEQGLTLGGMPDEGAAHASK